MEENYETLKDKLKTKVLKYIMFQKRTEQEIRNKFGYNNEILEDVIQELKEQEYINDYDYIETYINDCKKLKNLSIKEIKYKLYSKGVSNGLIEDYMDKHYQELEDYELNSAIKLFNKNINIKEKEEIIQYLLKKGYNEDIIRKASESI